MKENNLYYIEKEHVGITLGDYLKKKLLLSRRSLIKIKKAGSVKVNGSLEYMDYRLKEGDKLEFSIEEENSENILPEFMELDIIYEDDYMAVVNKNAGIPTHPSRNHYMGTLANGLMYYWMEAGRDITIRPVNRLDRNTSGLVVFAKSSHIQHLMSLHNYKSKMKKEYLALVQGIVKNDSGTVEAPIAREVQQSIRRVVREDGDRAVTHYEVLQRFQDYTLLKLILETGRTHQIRVHMAYIGHPILGDDLYGGSQDKIKRHALHAFILSMPHPMDGRPFEFTAPVPEDMGELIKNSTVCFSE
ncbi:MAG: RluA family pseudouridine synthase [Caulobacteraceae bacterium]